MENGRFAVTGSLVYCSDRRPVPRLADMNQSLQQTAGHDSFLATIAHRCPAAAELSRSVSLRLNGGEQFQPGDADDDQPRTHRSTFTSYHVVTVSPTGTRQPSAVLL